MNQTETNNPATPELTIRVLKKGLCQSLSGKSKLTYEIGCNAESAIYFRVVSNSGSGFFSNEWIAADSIGMALGESSNITSFTLHSIFKGRSLNNGGFLLAALKHEGLVWASGDKVRSYQLGDPGKFMDEMKLLMDKPADAPAEVKHKKVKKTE